MSKDEIDCPYYKEYMTGRNANQPTNCWDKHAYTEDSNLCNVPGQSYPLCNIKRNGYNKKGIFVAKVDKYNLQKVIKDFEYKESLKPENIVKRLSILETKIEKL